MKAAWWRWLGVLIAIDILGSLAAAGLYYGAMPVTADITHAVTHVALIVWLAWGLSRFWELRRTRALAIIVVSLALFGWASRLHVFGNTASATAIVGIWSMAALFYVGLWLIRLVLRPRFGICGIARTVIDEAVRMRVAIVLILLLLLFLPILSSTRDAEEITRYRLQFFMAWSLGGTTVLLSILTIAIACGTICNEIKNKQIFHTLTKPVTRLEYLLGKWLGIMLLNLVLVGVAGVAIYVFAHMLLQQEADLDTRRQVAREILAARVAIPPMPPESMDFPGLYRERVEQLQRGDPTLYGADPSELTEELSRQIQNDIRNEWMRIRPLEDKTYVFRGLDRARAAAERADKTVVLGETQTALGVGDTTITLTNLRVRPLKLSSGSFVQIAGQDYIYRVAQDMSSFQSEDVTIQLSQGIAAETPAGATVNFFDRPTITLRIKPFSTPVAQNRMLWMVAEFNGRVPAPLRIAHDAFYLMPIPVDMIEDDQLVVRLFNVNPYDPQETFPGVISFTDEEAMTLLYRVDNFGPNLVRALAIVWIRIAFYAMLGLAAGTFLSFPIACLLAGLVFFVSGASAFLTESLQMYAYFDTQHRDWWGKITWTLGQFSDHLGQGEVWSAVKMIIGLLGNTVVKIVPSLSEYNPTPLLRDGLYVSYGMVWNAFVWVGIFGAGVLLLIGWAIFRRRELAAVTV